MISIACRCGKRLSTDDAHVGKQVACPNCGESILFDPERSTKPPPTQDLSEQLVHLEPEIICPACGRATVILGELSQAGGPTGGNQVFVPNCDSWGLLARIFRSRSGVLANRRFRSCLACGHLWSSLPPEDLRACVEKHGDEDARRKLRPFGKVEPDHELA